MDDVIARLDRIEQALALLIQMLADEDDDGDVQTYALDGTPLHPDRDEGQPL